MAKLAKFHGENSGLGLIGRGWTQTFEILNMAPGSPAGTVRHVENTAPQRACRAPLSVASA